MSGPLFLLYMYAYPGSIPSWFIIDAFHEKHERDTRKAQETAVKYWKGKKIPPKEICLNNLNW